MRTLWIVSLLYCSTTMVVANHGHEDHDGEESEEDEGLATLILALFIIATSVLFEVLKETAEHHTHDLFKPVVEKLFGEMTVLGFIGIVFFLLSHAWDGKDGILHKLSEDWFHEAELLPEKFEEIHFIIFFVMVLFIVIALLTLSLGYYSIRNWRKYEETAHARLGLNAIDADLINDELDLEMKTGGLLHYLGLRDEDEYLRLRERFTMDERICSKDFDFASYLATAAGLTYAEMVGVHPMTWLWTSVVFTSLWALSRINEHASIAVFIAAGYALNFLCLLTYWKLRKVKLALLPPHHSHRLLNISTVNAPKGGARDPLLTGDMKDIDNTPPYLNQPLMTQKKAWPLSILYGGIPNRHEAQFWFGQEGVHRTTEILRLILLQTVIYTAMFFVSYASVLWNEHPVLPFIAAVPPVVILIFIPLNARILSITSNVEMMRKRDVIKRIERQQKSGHLMKHVRVLTLMASHTVVTADDNPESPRFTRRSLTDPAEVELVQDLQTLFESFDKDDSGSINATEVGEIMAAMGRRLSPTQLQATVDVMDRDGSGEIDCDEFVQAMLKQHRAAAGMMNDDGAIGEMFRIFDQDGSGQVSIEEVKHVFTALGQKWELHDLLNFFQEIDVDGDGDITVEEFTAFVKKVNKAQLG